MRHPLCPECRAADRKELQEQALEAEAMEIAHVTKRILRSASSPRVAFAAMAGVLEALAKDAGRKPSDVARELIELFKGKTP